MKNFFRKAVQIFIAVAPFALWVVALYSRTCRVQATGWKGKTDKISYGVIMTMTAVSGMAAVDDVRQAITD